MDHFKKLLKKEDGRFYVAWPCKDENCKLPKKVMNSVSKELNHYRND